MGGLDQSFDRQLGHASKAGYGISSHLHCRNKKLAPTSRQLLLTRHSLRYVPSAPPHLHLPIHAGGQQRHPFGVRRHAAHRPLVRLEASHQLGLYKLPIAHAACRSVRDWVWWCDRCGLRPSVCALVSACFCTRPPTAPCTPTLSTPHPKLHPN